MGPCGGRDPSFRGTDGFCLYTRQSAVRDALRWLDSRPVAAHFEHKSRAVPGFTAKYGVDRLVWYEAHEALEGALIRERQIEKWKRDWKINLIERDNARWIDLYSSLPA